jgi:hypothetical protein
VSGQSTSGETSTPVVTALRPHAGAPDDCQTQYLPSAAEHPLLLSW